MTVSDKVITAELNEILSVKVLIALQQNRYAALLEADQPLEILKGVRLEIKRLKNILSMLERDAPALSN
jgi:hypothetical protein